MSNEQYKSDMESLQFSGHPIKWYVHGKNNFNKRQGYNSRGIAEQIAKQGEIVTPDFCD